MSERRAKAAAEVLSRIMAQGGSRLFQSMNKEQAAKVATDSAVEVAVDLAEELLAARAQGGAQEWPKEALERIEWWTNRCAMWEGQAISAKARMSEAMAESAQKERERIIALLSAGVTVPSDFPSLLQVLTWDAKTQRLTFGAAFLRATLEPK